MTTKTRSDLIALIEQQEMLLAQLVMHVPVSKETSTMISETFECLEYTQKVLHDEKHN